MAPDRDLANELGTRAVVTLSSLIAVVALGVASIFFALLSHSRTNTLENNGRWTATKTSVEMHLMGSESFVLQTQALAGNHVNLGAWHGYQEIVFNPIVHPKEISFRFYLAENAYLTFIFNRTSESFSGIRFSSHPDFRSMYLAGLPSGEFRQKTRLPLSALQKNLWHDCRVAFFKNMIDLFVDGERIGTIPVELEEDQKIGFRGSMNPVYVDDIEVVQIGDATPVYESFSNFGRVPRLALQMFLAALLLECLLLVGATILHRTIRTSISFLMAMNIFAGVFATSAFLVFFFGYAKSFPTSRQLLGKERLFAQEQSERIVSSIERRYNNAFPEATSRILVVGTSQTWGVGAATVDDTFVNVLERTLNEKHGESQKFQCVNGGIQSQVSTGLLELYTQNWLELSPKLTVLNLSHNDQEDPKTFEESLNAFLDLNEEAGIETLFVLEACSAERYPDALLTHEIMRNVAETRAVPFVDMYKYMRSRQDEGYLWWDFIHPTTYGHQLIGERLAEEISTWPLFKTLPRQ